MSELDRTPPPTPMEADPDLRAFIDLLRGATPDEALVQQARGAVLANAAAGAGGAAALGSGAMIKGSLIALLLLAAVAGAVSLYLPDAPAPTRTTTSKHHAGLAMLDRAPTPPDDPVSLEAAVDSVEPEPAEPDPVAVEPRPAAHRRGTTRFPSRIGPASGPSSTLRSAMLRYRAEQYGAALLGFSEVVEGATDDSPSRVAEAELFLAKCLYHLGLYNASLAAFGRIGRSHPYFVHAAPWLAMLSERLPDAHLIIRSVSRYELADLDPRDAPHPPRLLYLLGRSRYDEGRLDDGIALFRRVPEDAPNSLEARFFEGISHVRRGDAPSAQRAFRRLIRLVELGRIGGHPDPQGARQLALMSVARLDYSSAMQLPPEERDRASVLLAQAYAAWAQVPLGSELGRDALAERTWALYVTQRYDRALGQIHAFESPTLREQADPELLVLRAVIELEHCQWASAEGSVRLFHERYDPLVRAVARTVRMARGQDNAMRMLAAVDRRQSRVPIEARPRVRALFAAPELSRLLLQVRSIEAEQRLLAETVSPQLTDALSSRLASELRDDERRARERAGALAASRLAGLLAELRERMSQIDTVELELTRGRRRELDRDDAPPMADPSHAGVYAIQGGARWPFDGEFWPDELGSYERPIVDRCAARRAP